MERRSVSAKVEGGVRLRVAGVPAIAVFFVAKREEVVLGGGEAMEPELEIGAGIGEFGFDGADGLKIGNVAGGEGVVGFHFFFGEMDDLGEDAVARGVERRALLAFGRFRATRFLGVLSIGTETRFGNAALGFGGWRSGGGFRFVVVDQLHGRLLNKVVEIAWDYFEPICRCARRTGSRLFV